MTSFIVSPCIGLLLIVWFARTLGQDLIIDNDGFADFDQPDVGDVDANDAYDMSMDFTGN